ncbi:autotransporter outer membrane beta-barrel domain-containing protein [Burkholderia ubonensis]|uniref:autotransporter outer membrane beta-barrel domain-containing protein n=1 Tax=Burkholderia ubonensis TaxID=101571 RepID=UPI0012F8120D|nr:autotransporter outer membrane beta-barrel domain-containing protein [Burkholderia ubonensis]
MACSSATTTSTPAHSHRCPDDRRLRVGAVHAWGFFGRVRRCVPANRRLRRSRRRCPQSRLDGQGSTDVPTRVGVRVHGVTAMPAGRELRPFIEASWWHGPGSRSLTLDGNAFSFSVPRDRAALRIGATGQIVKRFAVSASIGVEGNLSDYSVVKGQLAAKYRW